MDNLRSYHDRYLDENYTLDELKSLFGEYRNLSEYEDVEEYDANLVYRILWEHKIFHLKAKDMLNNDWYGH
jgi:uncharacterized protein (UPF0332 family)